MAEITYVDALNQAIKEEMRRDEKVFIMGESIRGGIYGVTGGLSQEFDERVIDTPLSENGFVGAAVGAAAVGMRPIVQSLSSFLWVAMDQLVSQAAKMRYMFGGQVNLPIVYRCGMNYGNNTAAHHTDRPYSMYMNMPGLKIVIPTTPADAKGLLKTAIRDNDPVMFFEDNNVAGMRGEVPEDEDFTIPFGIADVKREGTDVTVVALAGMVPRALSVADALEGEGVSVEVIDPRTIVPLDKQTILKSVEKTGRLVVVDPAHKSCSVASEISAM
ncbi:MAG: alpha-ketoacid dehydrogenase subunit beta, partial [Chloroflexi bacterium]|nr:alpha-ketoacid dehydrogenase subunit beta [Chloroflexota bacterium]